jgi:hypothetical protein
MIMELGQLLTPVGELMGYRYFDRLRVSFSFVVNSSITANALR